MNGFQLMSIISIILGFRNPIITTHIKAHIKYMHKQIFLLPIFPVPPSSGKRLGDFITDSLKCGAGALQTPLAQKIVCVTMCRAEVSQYLRKNMHASTTNLEIHENKQRAQDHSC